MGRRANYGRSLFRSVDRVNVHEDDKRTDLLRAGEYKVKEVRICVGKEGGMVCAKKKKKKGRQERIVEEKRRDDLIHKSSSSLSLVPFSSVPLPLATTRYCDRYTYT